MSLVRSETGTIPGYKEDFNKTIEESRIRASKPFWHPENPLPKGGTYEVLVSQGVDIMKGAANTEDFLGTRGAPGEKKETHLNLLTKTSSCHDIWMSNQYCTPEWRPRICQSVYTVDYINKLDHTFKLNPELVSKENNAQITQISEYSNALHNKGVFINPKFQSC